MTRTRRGFTLVEILIVIVIMGILATIAMPKLSTLSRRYTVDSAKQDVAAYLAQARAAAIQNGRNGWFIRNGNTIMVALDTSAGAPPAPFTQPLDLKLEHGVSVTMPTNPDSIRYDPRGIAVGLGGVVAIVVKKNGIRDSVCVIGLGRISAKDCHL